MNTKAFAVVAAALYLVSPIDLIPDVIPILGWLDDAGVLVLLINYLRKPQEPPETQQLAV